MTDSSSDSTSIDLTATRVADILLVGILHTAIGLQPEDFSQANSGREALAMLKVIRFRLIIASLNVSDMPVWELFQHARKAQGKLQCILVDERLTPEDELRVRQLGAGVIVAINPALCAALIRPARNIA